MDMYNLGKRFFEEPKRKSREELMNSDKKYLVRTILFNNTSYNKLKEMIGERQLEIEFLKRRIKLLEEKIQRLRIIRGI